MKSKIKLIIYSLAILGLVSELLVFVNLDMENSRSLLFTIRSILGSLNLSFFNSTITMYSNFETGLHLNYINTAFYAMLLAGAIIYSISNERETRLIRFVMSVILMSNILLFIWGIVTPLFYWSYIAYQDYWWVASILGEIKNALFIYITYVVLKQLHKTKILTEDVRITATNPDFISAKASNWVRLGNLIIDVFVCFFIFSTIISWFAPWLQPIAETMGERFALFVFYVIVSLLYFPFFELLFGATPAKFLTETRVLNEDRSKPRFKTIMLRTVSRHIPLEPFSFLAHRNWHDTISDTQVVREVGTGVKGRWYFLILPSILFIAVFSYFAHEKYDDYLYYQYRVREHNHKIETIKTGLKGLSTSHVIKIEDVNAPYSSEDIYLKIEEIKGDELVASVIQTSEDYTKSLVRVEQVYAATKNQLSVIPLKRSDLEKAYTADLDQYEANNRRTVQLLSDGREFEITEINQLYCPSIYDRGTGSYGNDLSIELINRGRSAKVVSVDPIEGNVTWEGNTDKEVPTVTSGDYPTFYIQGTGYKQGSKYAFRLTLADSLDNKFFYIIQGVNMEKTVTRVTSDEN